MERMKKRINKEIWKKILKGEKILTDKEAEEMLETINSIRKEKNKYKKRIDGFGIAKGAEPFKEEEMGHKEFG